MFNVREGNDGYYLKVQDFQFEYGPFIWIHARDKVYWNYEKSANYSDFEKTDVAVGVSNKNKAFVISPEKWVIKIL